MDNIVQLIKQPIVPRQIIRVFRSAIDVSSHTIESMWRVGANHCLHRHVQLQLQSNDHFTLGLFGTLGHALPSRQSINVWVDLWGNE